MSDDRKARLHRAHEMVHALCRPKGSEGARDWTMSVPARPDHDPDLVISDGLKAGDEALAREERLRGVVQKLIDWNERYPSSRIYGEAEIRKIAAEMDAIHEEARAALNATAPNGEGDGGQS